MIKRLLLLPVMLFVMIGALQASDYNIPTIKTDVRIDEDGTVHIDDHLTYVFDGSFSWAQYELPLDGVSEVRNIRVSEQDTDYVNENSEDDGTFSVAKENGSAVIKWHYSASDTTRTFTISYELTEALSVGPDVAEFFWNYLSAGRDKSTEQLSVTILLPDEVSADDLHAWSRITGDRSSVSIQNGTIKMEAFDLSRQEPASLRTLFPTSILDESSIEITDPKLTLERALQEEHQYEMERQEQAEREAFYASITQEITLIITLLSILTFILLYRRYGARHSTRSISDRETVMIPGEERPALVGKLLSSLISTGNHMVATIFDLARRGWFTIHEEKPDEEETSGWFSAGTADNKFIITKSDTPADDTVAPDEKIVLDFISKRIDSGENEIKKILSGSGSDSTKWYSRWRNEVKKQFDEKKWIDKSSYIGLTLNVIIQVLLVAAGFYMLYYGTSFAILAVITCILMLIGSAFMLRRTPEGEVTYRRWKAYADGLKNADKQTIRMELMDRHFIYATAFHLSEKQINNLVETSDQTADNLFPWIIFAQGSMQTPGSIASSVSTLAASGTTSFSGVSGGGGAVTGSAGGGASASAG